MNESLQKLIDAIREYILRESPDYYSWDEADEVARDQANRIDDEM